MTWRIIGTLDTFLLSWFISNDVSMGFLIGGFELVTKMLLYYVHERVWFKSKIKSSNRRHIFKTFSWRAVGTLDTIILGWIITGNPITGLKIGGAEVITKMVLYFAHEKLWYRIDFGLNQRNERKRLSNLKNTKEV
ncbi:DUF2061 domain-containing protein [Winogradskyella bathintestinalis]|uniref:DUF2061 domain-containing protein n=1 Tax=Winogradskyella bathintestinalis TaxID=3035208 RepID=A0ABT7ZTI6_9FLAO|nr:DUF2061 domain-containing protein [Winogradskyella bathintestinalis]MDN3492038.1 DUF2061 domain-containing protein [Winogradskyella bathintestinalis]